MEEHSDARQGIKDQRNKMEGAGGYSEVDTGGEALLYVTKSAFFAVRRPCKNASYC